MPPRKGSGKAPRVADKKSKKVSINVTTRDVYSEAKRLGEISRTNEKKIINSEKAQIKDEIELAQNGSTCRKSTLDKISSKFPVIDEDKLEKETKGRFFSPSAMISTMCVTTSTFYVPNDSIITLLKLKRWIQNMRRIGAASAFGVAMEGDLGNAADMFVLKAPKDKSAQYELTHELIVGLYGTNKLRSKVPNFSYIYGGFQCASPIIDQDKKVRSFCVGGDPVQYVIYEDIKPALSLVDYVKNCTPSQFLQVYMQVLYALDIAHKEIDFTHYDLHDENILVREYPEAHGNNFQILYETERGSEYLTTSRIATFIDYGMSHIKYKGKSYGKYHLLDSSIYPDRSHPFHDMYKLLLFATFTAYEGGNDAVMDECQKIYRFFNPKGDVFDAADKQFKKVRYAIPYYKTKNVTLFDLARHIRSVCNCDFLSKDPTNDIMLACVEGCPTVGSIYKEIGVDNRTYRVKSFYEFYDIYQATGKKPDMIYDKVSEDYDKEIITDYEYLVKRLKGIYMVDLTKKKRLTNKDGEEYMDFLYELVELIDLYNTYLLQLYIGEKVMKMYGDEDFDLSQLYLDEYFDPMVKLVNKNEKKLMHYLFKDDKYNEHFDVAKRIQEIHSEISQ
jgi:hypothetical protein